MQTITYSLFINRYLPILLFTTFIFTVPLQAQPGTLDKSFGDSGKTIVPSEIRSIAVQADDKIVTIEAPRHGGWSFELARYKKNGTPDPSFGKKGVVTTAFSWIDTKGNGVAIQADGKIVAVGCTAGDPFFYGTDFALARYFPDGTLDSSFGMDGKVITGIDSGYSSESFQSVAILPDGKIIGGGYIYSANGGFALMRFNTNGSTDSSFGVNGLAVMDGRGSNSVYAMGIEPDGRIILGGIKQAYYYNFTMACFNSNGTVDSTFGLDGIVTTHFATHTDVRFGAMAVQNDGKIVFKESNNEGTVIIARFKSNGSFDPTFANKGILMEERSWVYLGALCIQADDKIVSAGELSKGDNYNALVVKRYNINGDIDSSFGNDGTTTTQFDNALYYKYFVNATAIQKNGDIVFGGYLLTRYHGDSSNIPLIVRIKQWLQHHGFFYQLPYNAGVNYYAVQRSSDGVIFKEIARLAYNPSTSQFEDNTAAKGNNYYRLKAVQKNGTSIYSNTVLVKETPVIQLFPNPVKDKLQVLGLPAYTRSVISIVDLSGHVHTVVVANGSSSSINTTFLSSGSYLLKIQYNDNITTLPFIKE